MDFSTRLQALADDAQSFADVHVAEIKVHLAAADSLLDTLRRAGIGVKVRHPIGVHEGLAATRFELSLRVEIEQ